MNRYQANRIAKQIFVEYGNTFWAFEETALAEHDIQLGSAEAELVVDYFQRTVNRVSDWLRL